jgi:signal transduction histidine kinase
VGHEINNTINFISGALPPLRATITELKEAIVASRLPEVITENNSQYFLATLARRQGTTDFNGLLAQIDLLLGNIEEGANRTTVIVHHLKSFSRSSGQEFHPADLHEGLESTLTITRHQCRDRIEIETDLAPDLPLVECLGGQINQVFLNILTNAIQAITREGRIEIKSWSGNGEIHFAFSDSGGGIPAELLPRIFDPFFTTKETGKGTGLGLGICYQIVKKHGGQIKVKSQLGVGSTFEVILPIKQQRER